VTSFFYVVSIAFHTSVPALRKCMNTSRKNSLSESAVTHAPGRGESVREPYWTFIRRWISMGFTPPLLKKRTTDAVLVWCMLQAGPPYFTLLLRRRVAFLHHTATCRPLFKPWVSLLPTYKTVELCFELLSHF